MNYGVKSDVGHMKVTGVFFFVVFYIKYYSYIELYYLQLVEEREEQRDGASK